MTRGAGAPRMTSVAAEVRPLPPVRPRWRRDADVVVIGSGAAGITAALTAAARGLRVLVVTKDLAGGASPLAQGGLAAAIGPGDSAEAHARDTMTAGAGLCDRETVAALAAGSPAAIDWLVAAGARLERRDLRLEGGHSRRRIVHSGDDASGAEVHRALLAALAASPVEVLDGAVALDLLTDDDGSAAGISVLRSRPHFRVAGDSVTLERGLRCQRAQGRDWGGDGDEAGLIGARVVVVAAGGLGQAFGVTSNPAGATGDGVALAARAGAVLRDLEFVQFHPTVLWRDGAAGQRPLVTEALRGAGAVLRDLNGKPLMAGRHPLGDLAPRDIVAAAMFEEIARFAQTARAAEAERAGAGAGHLWLDATALGRGVLEGGFPTVTAACREQGIDPVTDLIPVAPAAHYSCGGIAAGLAGRTSIPGLLAVGEAASTGVHGANRLASNSLVEAVIVGHRAGQAIAGDEFAKAGAAYGENWTATAGGDATAGTGPYGGWRSGELAYGENRSLRRMASARAASASERATGAGPASRGGPTRFPAALPAQPNGTAGTGGGLGGFERGAEPPLGNRRYPGELWRVPEERGDSPGEPGFTLRNTMSRHAGVVRDSDGLREVLRVAARMPLSLEGEGRGVVEAANLHAVSVLIAAAALHRTESRGCHRRRDAPEAWPDARHTLIRWTPDGLRVTS